MKKDNEIYKHLIDRMKADDSVDAPADSIKFVKNCFRSHTVENQSTFRRIMAIVKIDLAPGKLVLGERSSSVATPRQILFDAGEHAIDLRISTTGTKFRVEGQILGYGFEKGTITIGEKVAKIDEGGRFDFGEIAAGRYNIEAKGGGLVLVVEDFSIK